jgi:hypothetical protein
MSASNLQLASVMVVCFGPQANLRTHFPSEAFGQECPIPVQTPSFSMPLQGLSSAAAGTSWVNNNPHAMRTILIMAISLVFNSQPQITRNIPREISRSEDGRAKQSPL